MEAIKDIVVELKESFAVRLVLGCVALGAVPFYFLSLAKASLVG